MSILIRVTGAVLGVACAILLVLLVLGIFRVGPLKFHGGGKGLTMVMGGCCAGIAAGFFMAVNGRRPESQ